MKVEVDVPSLNKPTVSEDVKQHFNHPLTFYVCGLNFVLEQ